MADQPLPTSIPSSLHRFFWDVDATKLNPSEYPLYVINRLLDKGNLEAARWVLRNFSKEMIVDSMKHGAPMLAINATFWSHYFDVSLCEMPKPIPYHRKPSGLWRFA